MKQKFNELPWHDAELHEIFIDRNHNDSVRILIRWPESCGSECFSIEFLNCYAFQGNMHFGFHPPEFILEAECIQQCFELDKLKKIWEKMNLNLSKLKCYRITTNSTNSIINIYALDFQVSRV